MPVYKATVEIQVDGDDVDWLNETIDEIRDLEGVTVNSIAPHHDNPENYPDHSDC